MDHYSSIARAYDFLDKRYFSEPGKNPRQTILNMIPDGKIRILDLCCGTLSNSIAIARHRPAGQVVGLDLSRGMLREAERKLSEQRLTNVDLRWADAAKTGLEGQSFDCVIIGLVLHELSPQSAEAVLREAHRLLRDAGRLIVLEWEPPQKLSQRVKFFPLYLGELLNCKTFRQFYTADKERLFRNYGFLVEQQEHCNYTVVLNMKKVPSSPCIFPKTV